PIALGHGFEGTRQDQGAFALPEIPARFLAVRPASIAQVQYVVLNLKGRPRQKREGVEALEIALPRDQRPQAARVNKAVPTRLLEDHREVVVLLHVTRVVVDPAELHRLPFERLQEQVVELFDDVPAQIRSQTFEILRQNAQHQGIHGVTDIDGYRHSVSYVQRR